MTTIETMGKGFPGTCGLLLVFGLAALAACKSDRAAAAGESESGQASAGAESEGPRFQDRGDQHAYERCVDRLPELRTGIPSGEVSPTACAAMLSYAGRIAGNADAGVRAVATEVQELCGRDVWLVEAQARLDEAVANRQSDPEASIGAECQRASFAVDHVEAAFTGHEQVGAMRDRVAGLCGN